MKYGVPKRHVLMEHLYTNVLSRTKSTWWIIVFEVLRKTDIVSNESGSHLQSQATLHSYPYNSHESGDGNTRTNPPLLEYSSRVWRNILNSSGVKPSSLLFLAPEDSGLVLGIKAPAVAERCLWKEEIRNVTERKEKDILFSPCRALRCILRARKYNLAG